MGNSVNIEAGVSSSRNGTGGVRVSFSSSGKPREGKLQSQTALLHIHVCFGVDERVVAGVCSRVQPPGVR